LTRPPRFLHAAALALIYAAGQGSLALAQFETRSSTPTDLSGFSLAVGDFNRDGKLDLAVASNDLQVFLGNGDGTFQLPANYLTGTGAIFVAAADLNGDGKLDLAVADLNGLFILMGNGDGTFQTPVAYTTACIPVFVATGDFNGDKKLDLLVTYSSGNCPYVSIFLGNGDGTFQTTPINTTPLYSPTAPGIGDFNGDGKLDLAVAEQFGTISQVEILLGNGNGTFSAGAIYSVGSSPTSVAVADFRGNGKLDLAVATLVGGTDVLLGNGDGTFQANGGLATPDADWVLVADFNGDGKPDLAVSQGQPSGAAVALGNGDGTFQPVTFYPAGKDAPFVAAGDFNGDHKTDLVLPYYSFSYYVTVLLNAGVVSFSPTTPVNYPIQLVGTASPRQTVVLTNTGTTALSIKSLSTQAPFQAHSTCGSSVAAGSKCKINVVFKPQVIGSVTGTVSIVDSASSKPQVIELIGVGTVVGFSPVALTFPAQKVGTKSPPQNVTLTNHGATALAVTQIVVEGTNYQEFFQTNNCPTSLNAGASCTIAVTFSPTKMGTRRAVISVEDDGGGSPQFVPLTGTGD
jgi:hypothetical protein